MNQKPTVGRIVTYQSYGSPKGEHKSEPRAAIITDVGADGTTCQFTVFNPSGLFFNRCAYSEEPRPGCWSWPQRT